MSTIPTIGFNVEYVAMLCRRPLGNGTDIDAGRSNMAI